MDRIEMIQPLDLSFYQVVPMSLQSSSFFFEVIKAIGKSDAFSQDKELYNKFKATMFQTLSIEQKTKWAQDFNDQMEAAYERLGAGTSINPSKDDKPSR